ncbi:AtpZ/AtpI family protein [Rickettsiales bacterium]|nr:AtpZ/AtpI family protein [Rickettsiales bacterium]
MQQDKEKPSSIEDLDKSIRSFKAKYSKSQENEVSPAGIATRISVELLSGVVIGCLFGYYLDVWLDTSPIFFIVCFFLGVAGSALNIYKMSQR